MVDSVGCARHLKEARELKGGAGFWSRWSTVWNPNKLIQVELIFDGDVISMSVDELKEYLLASFAGRPQGLANWNPGSITLVEMQDGLKAAKTFSEVFRLVLQKVLIKPELR